MIIPVVSSDYGNTAVKRQLSNNSDTGLLTAISGVKEPLIENISGEIKSTVAFSLIVIGNGEKPITIFNKYEKVIRMDTRVKINVNNNTEYNLSLYKKWGGPWDKEPPKNIEAKEKSLKFSLNDNDRAGVVYLATDKNGNEFGFVTMSFICPKSSSNSAEGSPSTPGTYISAGLQKYEEHGTPVEFTYNIGESNEACWSSGSSNDGDITCDETSMKEWTRIFVVVKNPESETLRLKDSWCYKDEWCKEPEDIPAFGRKIFLLNDNDRAGIQYKLNGIPFNLSFTCPKSSSNSAEGSAFSGLQEYESHGTPVSFTYDVSTSNKASWSDSSSFNGKFECKNTMVTEVQNNWMSVLKENTQGSSTMKLGSVFFSGTHDSACYKINSPFAAGLARTQSQNFYSQLKGGVRYFDLRPKWESNKSFRFIHGDWNTNVYLKDLIDALKEFYDAPSTAEEIVILDFSHFDDFKKDAARYQDFVDSILNSEIADNLVSESTSETTLNEIWESKKNIIITLNLPKEVKFKKLSTFGVISNREKLFTDNENCDNKKRECGYADTNSVSEMNDKLNKALETDFEGKLWKFQNILTPRWYSNNVTILAAEANPNLYMNIESKKSWSERTNIVIIDFYSNDLAGLRDNLKHMDNQLAVYALVVNWKRYA
jgi:hypothetical protein